MAAVEAAMMMGTAADGKLELEEENTTTTTKKSSSSSVINHNCDTYLAPSLSPGVGGWGVFAGRDFIKNEIVEIFPRYIPLHKNWLQQSVLGDYAYNFYFPSNFNDYDNNRWGVVAFGNAMCYNHGNPRGASNNVRYESFGYEPDYRNRPWAAIAQGFVATKDISRGQELLVSYDTTGEWFKARGIEMRELVGVSSSSSETTTTTTTLSEIQLLYERREQEYCSKLISGIGQKTWKERILRAEQVPEFRNNFKAPPNIPLGGDRTTAVVKETTIIKAGDVIEIAPALVVPAKLVRDSPLSPMTIYWNDLENDQKLKIRQLREVKGGFWMKGIVDDSGGEIKDDILRYYEEAAILPVSGNLALVQKVGRQRQNGNGNNNPNCRMEILEPTIDDPVNYGGAGLVLKLIATQDIQPGEHLRLNLPDNSSMESKMTLQQHLTITGQPIPRHLL